MSDKPDPILQQKEQQQLKTQLLWRLGIAGVLIAAVLGAISWLDREEKNAPPEVQIPRIAPAASAIAAVISPTPIIENTEASAPAASAVVTAPPTTAPTAAISNAPNQTQIEAINNVPARKTELPASKKPIPTPIETSKATAAPLLKLETEPVPATATPPAKFPITSSSQLGYSVQAGVFLHSNNAEKLLAQIQAAGIPAYLETRVQIGPFKTKAEAEAAVKKLRKLGIEPILKTQ